MIQRASFVLTAALVITSFVLSGTLNTNNAVAASNHIIFKEKFNGDSAFANKIIKDGSTTTNVFATAFDTTNGNTVLSATVYKVDESTGTTLTDWTADGFTKLTIGGGLSTATFSATLTGFDYATNTDKTVTVTGDLTATGKVQTTSFGTHTHTPAITAVFNFHGKERPASGTLNFQGDINLNIGDATGGISNAGSGSLTIQKN